MGKILLFLFHSPVFLSMMLLHSCAKSRHTAQIPSYIHIEKIDLFIADTNTQGSSSHKITDAWVYINDDFKGAYELPTTFPVLVSGKNSLKIKAGIKDNGVSVTRVIYPFFDFYIDNSFTLFSDSIVNANPVVQYYSSAKFAWIEDFEKPSFSLDSIFPSYMKMQLVTDNSLVFEGNGSGYVQLTTANPIFYGVSKEKFSLPKGGANVYLELDYKCTENIIVYLFSHNPSGTAEDFVITINATNKSGAALWNKIYVDITPIISGNPYAANYQLGFQASILNTDIPSAEIYLDNIKLIHP